MKLIKTTLTGIGQIFLQENGLSGLIIVIAMFFSHWTLGVACFFGALIGTLTAQFLKYPPNEIKQGLYGFNASLALMCVMFTFGEVEIMNPIVWGLGVLASLVATLIMRVFIQRGKVAYTFPFVLSCWLFCWGVAKIELFGLTQNTPALAHISPSMSEPFYAWAEVNFGSSLITGVLLFVAIAISSPIAAMWGLAASAIGTAFAQYCLNVESEQLANGIYGFSPILVACAFAGTKRRSFFYVIAGSILAALIQFAVAQTGLATYTIGFIVASWVMLLIKKHLDRTEFDKNKLVKILNP
ncbi:urea transporter [Pasteurellaceae bacterium Pebbles2]|nr:urea transporter [Pasteurellaceae bacterium Pebbles2]